VLAANQIIDEVLFDRQWVERMAVSALIRTHSDIEGLNNMIWQSTPGIDALIEQEERRERRGESSPISKRAQLIRSSMQCAPLTCD
jgi:hypothetical protein